MKQVARRAAGLGVNIVFPRRCPVCGEIVVPFGELICPGCAGRLSLIRQPVCKKCGKEVESDRVEYCFDCTRHRHGFERNLALLNYDETASRSMAAIKYQNRREYLDFYGQAVCLKYGKSIKRFHPDGVVPVPVHSSRKKIRGFNQAEILAKHISTNLEIPMYPDALKRIKKTAPQKELNPAERLRNLKEAFVPGQLPGEVRTVLLVDDIYTTGSTLEACTGVLKSMGVCRVYGVTVCVGAMA
ncbi:MAG: ComF family protein [Hungatella sp.]|nr:ComF family protein [Hungatella sp.]